MLKKKQEIEEDGIQDKDCLFNNPDEDYINTIDIVDHKIELSQTKCFVF